jgi:hypothetical protein
MKTRWLVLSIVFATCYTSLMGDAMPFGMFSADAQYTVTSDYVDYTLFGMFDAVGQREMRIMEAQMQAELDAQQQHKQYQAYVDELLAVREAKRALRNQQSALYATATDAICYKLRNRLQRMEAMQQESLRVSQEQAPSMETVALLPVSCVETHDQKRIVSKDLAVGELIAMHHATRPSYERSYRVAAGPRQQKHVDVNVHHARNEQRVARCNKVQEFAQRYQWITSQLIDAQYTMLASLKKDLDYFCALTGRESTAVLAQLRSQEASGQYSNTRTSDILGTRYSF